MIENVYIVDKLKYNLLSINQLCEKGYKINFEFDKYSIFDSSSNKVFYVGNRIANVYINDVISTVSSNNCLVAKDNGTKWI